MNSTSEVRGGAPTNHRFSTIFSTQDASPDSIILLLWVTQKRKILSPFNLESIIVHWMMLYDAF